VCNDFGNHIPYSAYLEAFSETRIPARFPTAAPNLQPRDDIWPTETAPVIRRTDDVIEFVQLRWGLPPARPKGAPIINFRSEGRRFPKGRCLVPALHFFEFTGTKSRSRSGSSRRPGRTDSASRVCGALGRHGLPRPCRTVRATRSRC
jgi:putative SOS response-associated peptidase YedK